MGCGFLGPTAALLCHFTEAHGWPCVTGVFPGDRVAMHLQAGFNVVVVDRGSDGTTAGRYLVVMKLAPEPFGWTVAAFCLRPRAAEFEGPLFWARDRTLCQISLTYVRNVFRGKKNDGSEDEDGCGDDDDSCGDDDGCNDNEGCKDDLIQQYEETTNADVVCTNLCGGCPDLEECFEAHVFRSVDVVGDEDGVDVIISIIIK
ncbi:uncharacterized protein LOC104583228 [Brachypodium distachyon]|uniref:uncharacterized protein LOC104583228 n=1 Tax=Brachypodium distachyon TaxID=15368 RepID=UPI000D0D4D00|nr:uncharacterized protein LOC104583228 [Brachypodium distachyon]|eukprot:XP_024314586.1 uncharacterized protein LOC104583228 [Brachypodium distachyon]